MRDVETADEVFLHGDAAGEVDTEDVGYVLSLLLKPLRPEFEHRRQTVQEAREQTKLRRYFDTARFPGLKILAKFLRVAMTVMLGVDLNLCPTTASNIRYRSFHSVLITNTK